MGIVKIEVDPVQVRITEAEIMADLRYPGT